MAAWSHLPNAKYVDQLICSVRDNPDHWKNSPVWNQVWLSTPEWEDAWSAIRPAVTEEVWQIVRNDLGVKSLRQELWDSLVVLMAFEESCKFMVMSPEQLRVWITLSGDPLAKLLLPAVIIMGTSVPV